MEVILLERIRKLGTLGQKVKVRPGYGRNFLIPQGKAVSATKLNIEKFEARRAELEKLEAEQVAAAQVRAKTLTDLKSVTINVNAGEDGKMFGSISTRDIADAITKAGVEVAKSEVHLTSGALRHVGEYDIDVEFHSDVRVIIKLILASDSVKDED